MYTHVKLKSVVVLILFVVCMVFQNGSREVLAEEIHSVSHASWNVVYTDIDSMIEDADIIVKGKVNKQNVIGEDIIYTVSSVSVSKVYKGMKLKKLSVSQVGGVKGTKETPELDELPLLINECEYILFLKQSNIENQYYIVGAGQGVFLVNENTICENLQQVKSHVSNAFAEKLASVNEISSVRYDETSNLGYRWYSDTINCYINPNGQPSAGFVELLKVGAKSWNPYNPYVDVEFVNINMATVQVRFESANNNIVGLSVVDYYGSSASSATVTFYTGTIGSSSWKWQATACHEFGHVLGLSHYTTGIQPSAMYWDINYCETTPQQVDVNGMQTLYGY